MQISYKILFSIELLHEYRANGKSVDFEVVPSDDCLALFKGLSIEWRNNENRFVALVKENENGEPFINTPPERSYRIQNKESVFRIYLKLKNQLFANYTNIDLSTFNTQRLLFSNLSNNKKDNILYLSNKVNDIAAADYNPGDVAMEAATENVFEAIKKQAAASVKPLTDTGFWTSKGKLQYPTFKNDGIDFSGGLYSFKLSLPTTRAEVEVFGFNFNAAVVTYDVPVADKNIVYFQEPNGFVAVDLTRLKPGKYLIKINGESRFVYYDPQLAREKILGVVEIYNHLPATSDYSLLDASEKIRGLKYIIQFPNRKVLWKYTRKNNKANNLEDTSGAYGFLLKGEDFVSQTPIPLSEVGLQTLKLHFSNTDPPISNLPNPSANLLLSYEQDGYKYLCSGIFLNY